jgi:hypothetical protein
MDRFAPEFGDPGNDGGNHGPARQCQVKDRASHQHRMSLSSDKADRPNEVGELAATGRLQVV